MLRNKSKLTQSSGWDKENEKKTKNDRAEKLAKLY